MFTNGEETLSKDIAQSYADKLNMSLVEWAAEFGWDVADEGKTNGPTEVTPPVGQKDETAAGDSSSAATSLELPEGDLVSSTKQKIDAIKLTPGELSSIEATAKDELRYQIAADKNLGLDQVTDEMIGELLPQKINALKGQTTGVKMESVMKEFEGESLTFGESVLKTLKTLASWSEVAVSPTSRLTSLAAQAALTTDAELEMAKGKKQITEEYKARETEAVKEYNKGADELNAYAATIDAVDAELMRIDIKKERDAASITQEDVDNYNQLVETRNGIAFKFNEKQGQLADKIETATTAGEVIDMVNRTYIAGEVAANRMQGRVMTMAAGLGDFAKNMNPGKLVEVTTGGYTPYWAVGIDASFDAWTSDLYNESAKLDASTRKRQEFLKIGESGSKTGDLLDFTIDLFSEQIVNTAVTAAVPGAGLAIVSASAAGNKFHEMDIEIEEGKKISAAQYYTAAIMHGAGEYVSEKVTLGQAKTALGATKKMFNLDAASGLTNIIPTATKAFGAYGMNVAEEAGAEALSQIIGNWADKYVLGEKISVFDGVGEAAISGAFMSGTAFSAPSLAVDLTRAFTYGPEMKAAAARSKEIMDLKSKLDDMPLSDDPEAVEARGAISERIDQLAEENVAAMNAAASRIDELSRQDKRSLLDIDTKAFRFRAAIDRINSNSKLSDGEKSKLVERYANGLDLLENQKADIFANTEASLGKARAKAFQMATVAEAGVDFDYIEGETAADAVAQAKERVENSDLSEENKQKLNEQLEKAAAEENMNGFYLGAELGLPISLTTAQGKKRNGSVAAHEVSHATLFRKMLEGNADAIGLANDLAKYLIKNHGSLAARKLEGVLRTYTKEKGFTDAEIAEEIMAATVELTRRVDLDISRNKTLQGKLMTRWNKLFPNNAEITEVRTGKDVLDAIISFNSSFDKGELSGLAAKVIKGEVKAKQAKEQQKRTEGPAFSKTLTTEQNASVIDMLSRRAVRIEEAKKVAEKFGVAVQADAVQQRLETKIREQLSPLIGKIVTNRTKALYDPIAAEQRNNVSREDFQNSLRTEIEALAFEEFKEGKQDIEKFLVNRAFLRSNNLASRLGIESAATGGIKKDIDTAKGMAVQEEAAVAEDKPAYKNLIRRRVVSEDAMATIKGKIKPIVRTLKTRMDAEVSKNVTVKPWVNEARLTFGKQIDIILKKEMGGKKDGELRKFLLRNKSAILENMTTTYLMTAMPNAIQKKVDGQWTSDWKGKKIDRETTSTDAAGRTSGAEMVRRLPKAAMKISDTDFLANILQPDGNPIRGRKESLAKAIAEELAFDILSEEINNPDSEIREALELNQTNLGVELLDNFVAVAQRDFERGNVKFSLSPEQSTEFNKHSQRLRELLLKQDAGNLTKNRLLNALIKVYIEENPSEVLTEKDLEKFAKEAVNVVNRYIKKDIAQGVDFASFIEEGVKLNEGKSNLMLALDVAKSSLKGGYKALFEDGALVQRQRGLSTDYNAQVVAKEGEAGLIKILKWMKGHQTTSGKIGGGRMQIYAGVADFYDNNLNTIPGVKVEYGKGGISAVYYNGKLVENWKQKTYTPPQEATKKVTKDKVSKVVPISKETFKEEYNTRLEAAREAWDVLVDYLGFINEQGNAIDWIMTMMSLKSNMSSMLKAAAPVKYYHNGKPTANLRYEHIIPTEFMVLKLTQHFKGKKIDLNKLRDKYNVAIIPIPMDDNFNILVQSDMNSSWNYETDSEVFRYFNKGTFGFKNMETIEVLGGEFKGQTIGEGWVKLNEQLDAKAAAKAVEELSAKSGVKFSISDRKARVFDFDDTLARSNSKVLYTMPNGATGKLNATEFAKRSEVLEADGAVFDFSEFNKVVDGKKGPLFELAKFISESPGKRDMFVLTARPQDAALPIHKFLKGLGLTIPLENITGLANGAPKAKADWMLAKFEQGYNDFYFADDAIKNVKAVKDALKTIDAKSKVQQAKFSLAEDLSVEFNNIIERTKGVSAYKVFSKVQAELRGAKKGRFKFFIAPGADDFRGLVNYAFAGKGKQGEKDMSFFEEKLLTPYFKGIAAIESARQAIRRDYSAINKAFKSESKMMKKKIGDSQFTYDHALRVYLWEKQGTKVPGISKRDAELLREAMNQNPNLKSYADALLVASKRSEWMEPSDYWPAQTVLSDLNSMTEKIGRKKFLEEFIANSDAIFTTENLNKIEAVYGKAHREALEDSLYAMKNGSNRPSGNNRQVNKWLNWINGSTGAIMFFNRRSALLQMLSFTNFTNWTDNNPLMQAKAFANQKQYWSDFAMIFNSDKLKERRSGLKTDVSESELANVAEGANGKPQAILNYMLKIGFTPTQIADSFAIATGGAMFYRNRVNSYLKEGKTQKQAEEAAFLDFTKRSDEAQQSSDPALVSQQQRSVLGRLVLAFANTPMQYTRLMKKAALDLINGRGSVKENISKIAYYGVVQNFIFSSLQNALFALAFDDEDDEEMTDKEREKLEAKEQTRISRTINSMIDTVLRGSGIYGAVASTVKNVIMEYQKQEEKGFTGDHAYTILQVLNISPPIGSKVRKIYSAIQTRRFEKDNIEARGWALTADGKLNLGPNYSVLGSLVSGVANVPLDRVVDELRSVTEALDERNKAWQRIALALGWKTWDVGAINEEAEEIKAEAKKERKAAGIEKAKKTRAANKAEGEKPNLKVRRSLYE